MFRILGMSLSNIWCVGIRGFDPIDVLGAFAVVVFVVVAQEVLCAYGTGLVREIVR